MSEMPTDISKVLTLFYITIFVTFGLAILAMCAELAAGELKWLFIKIHYFGRKINWKRKSTSTVKKDDQMEVELKELLKIINQIRTKYPEKREITSVDILKVCLDWKSIDNLLIGLGSFNASEATLRFNSYGFTKLMFKQKMGFEPNH